MTIKAFCLNPHQLPNVRVHVGLCFYKLNMLEEALRAFQRAYNLNPSNMIALRHIGFIQLNLCEQKKSITAEKRLILKENATYALRHVYQNSLSSQPDMCCLIVLADFAFFERRYDLVTISNKWVLFKAEAMAEKIIKSLHQPKRIRMLALHILGQVKHIKVMSSYFYKL